MMMLYTIAQPRDSDEVMEENNGMIIWECICSNSGGVGVGGVGCRCI